MMVTMMMMMVTMMMMMVTMMMMMVTMMMKMIIINRVFKEPVSNFFETGCRVSQVSRVSL